MPAEINQIVTDALREATAGNGIDVDGVILKDSEVDAQNVVKRMKVTVAHGAFTAAAQIEEIDLVAAGGFGGVDAEIRSVFVNHTEDFAGTDLTTAEIKVGTPSDDDGWLKRVVVSTGATQYLGILAADRGDEIAGDAIGIVAAGEAMKIKAEITAGVGTLDNTSAGSVDVIIDYVEIH